jgi:DNA-binding beta-propeller fold protein YncE
VREVVGIVGVACLLLLPSGPAEAQPARDYTAYVASEAADAIAKVTFGPAGLRIDKTFPTGLMPTDVDGPHGVAMAPDGRTYFVSLAHGQPEGALWQYATADDKVLGRVTLGMFPATLQITPNGEFAYIVNFNLHGDRVPSSVSVVATAPMLEVARIRTCLMPHGSRINPAGTRHYSACMMDDTLVEIDTSTLRVSRHFVLTKGRETGRTGAPPASSDHTGVSQGTAHASGHGAEAPAAGSVACSPTWAQPSIDGRRVFVACNGTSEIVEIDVDAWTVTRRLPAGAGVYNLAVTQDRRLVTTNRRGQSVSVFDLASGRELARVPTRRRIVHGAAVTSDDRYAFITVEGVGGEPGTVEVLDLRTLTMAASIDVAPQAGGIDIAR